MFESSTGDRKDEKLSVVIDDEHVSRRVLTTNVDNYMRRQPKKTWMEYLKNDKNKKQTGSVVIAMVYGTAAMLPPPVAESRRIVYAIIATVAMFKLIIGCLLIYGVFGKKPRLILPWLITCWISVITLLALSVLGTALVMLYIEDKESSREITTMATVYFLLAVVLFCFGSVVSSRRDEIRKGSYRDSAQRLMRRDFNKFPLYTFTTYN